MHRDIRELEQKVEDQEEELDDQAGTNPNAWTGKLVYIKTQPKAVSEISPTVYCSKELHN